MKSVVTPPPDLPTRRPRVDVDASAAPLASALWLERELLDELLYGLTCQQLILQAGRLRWLAAADARVQAAVDALSDGELRRAVASTRFALVLGLRADATLDQIAESAPEPWAMLFGEHRDTLRSVAAEISVASTENRRLLQAGAAATQEALAAVGVPTDPTEATGYPGAPAHGTNAVPVMFDRQV